MCMNYSGVWFLLFGMTGDCDIGLRMKSGSRSWMNIAKGMMAWFVAELLYRWLRLVEERSSEYLYG